MHHWEGREVCRRSETNLCFLKDLNRLMRKVLETAKICCKEAHSSIHSLGFKLAERALAWSLDLSAAVDYLYWTCFTSTFLSRSVRPSFQPPGLYLLFLSSQTAWDTSLHCFRGHVLSIYHVVHIPSFIAGRAPEGRLSKPNSKAFFIFFSTIRCIVYH